MTPDQGGEVLRALGRLDYFLSDAAIRELGPDRCIGRCREVVDDLERALGLQLTGWDGVPR